MFQMKRVERLGTESVAGVAKIDKGDSLQLGYAGFGLSPNW